MKYTRIAGTGSAHGARLVTNHDIAKIVDTSHEWIMERSGIEQRYFLAEDETLLTLAEKASLSALEAAGVDPSTIDMVIVATTTPDKTFPSMGALLQHRLGLGQCPAFDLVAACAGFNYGLSLADSVIKTGQARRVLLLGAEALSRLINWTDRTTCFLFGDGAGAVVLEGSDEPGLIGAKLHADGQHQDILYARSGLCADSPYIVMSGNAVFKIAVNTLSDAVIEVLEACGMTESQVDWLVPHQANLRIINAIAKRLSLPPERVIININRYGNTSSASVPMALDEAIRDGRIKRGDVILLESFGGGLTWGSALLRY